ncbi:MAG: type II toxin-antitoxin system HicB family antitoxin [Chloroflexi bacterium]|nr:type II toxin-antitoxin system HicB family antitoxin [Chloroflexota bacterium]
MNKLVYWPVVIEKDADGYFAYCPSLQGCYTQGDTYEEVVANIRDAIQLHVADRVENSEPLPALEAISVMTLEVPYEPAFA